MSERHASLERQRRFWREATVTDDRDGFARVLLDGRPLRTPARAPLVVPQRVAAAIAAEWNAQGEHVLPATMPLTRLANTAIDGVATAAEAVAADIAAIAGGDLVLYRAATPAALVALQARHWDGIVADAEASLGVRLILAEGIMPVRQDARLGPAVRAALPTDPLALAALHQLTTLTGSALLALALARGALSFEDAWTAAHVDEDFNIAAWGEDAEAAARRALRRRDAEAAAFVLAAADGATAEHPPR